MGNEIMKTFKISKNEGTNAEQYLKIVIYKDRRFDIQMHDAEGDSCDYICIEFGKEKYGELLNKMEEFLSERRE